MSAVCPLSERRRRPVWMFHRRTSRSASSAGEGQSVGREGHRPDPMRMASKRSHLPCPCLPIFKRIDRRDAGSQWSWRERCEGGCKLGKSSDRPCTSLQLIQSGAAHGGSRFDRKPSIRAQYNSRQVPDRSVQREALSHQVKQVSRLLTKSASGVLAALRGSTYGREYDLPFRLLRPCWTAFLSILRLLLTSGPKVPAVYCV